MQALIGNYIIPYTQITGEKIDINLIEFIMRHWDAFILKQYHTYQFFRYLNNFKFAVNSSHGLQQRRSKLNKKAPVFEEGIERETLVQLSNEVGKKQREYLVS